LGIWRTADHCRNNDGEALLALFQPPEHPSARRWETSARRRETKGESGWAESGRQRQTVVIVAPRPGRPNARTKRQRLREA
jgi:hypothetical protein